MSTIYCYKNNQSQRFRFTDTLNNDTYYFRLTTVNVNVVAMQFFSDNTFKKQIAIPKSFSMRDGNGYIKEFMNSFFISWIDDYTLLFDDLPIWKLNNAKQHITNTYNDNLQQLM